MRTYQESIRERLATKGLIGKYDPRHIQGYMLLEHSTLDGLSSNQFNSEIDICVDCIEEGGRDAAESNARSYGL